MIKTFPLARVTIRTGDVLLTTRFAVVVRTERTRAARTVDPWNVVETMAAGANVVPVTIPLVTIGADSRLPLNVGENDVVEGTTVPAAGVAPTPVAPDTVKAEVAPIAAAATAVAG